MKNTTTEKKLANGITLLYIDIPGVSSFDLAIAFNSGYRFASCDNIEKYELPHMLEHMVFDGSRAYRSNDELQAVFSNGGGESNGFTTPYHNVFAFHNRARNAQDIIRAALDMVYHPTLSEQSFMDERQVIENEVQESMGDFAGNASLYTLQQIIPDFPTSCDTQLARLPNVTYEDIAPYHQKYYTTANATIVIAADFHVIKKSDLEKTIIQGTKNVRKGKRHSFPKFEVTQANPTSVAGIPTHKSLADTIACTMFAKKGAAKRKNMLALSLFSTIASGMKSYSVNYKLRKQGLIYGMDLSAFESFETYGFELNITANNQKFSSVYAYTLAGIRDLAKTGITKNQFESARRDFAEGFEDSNASTDAIIGWYFQDYLVDGTLLSPDDYAQMALAITQDEMLKQVAQVFRYDNMYHSVFSSKPIRASSSMELLTKQVLKNNKQVTEELIEQNSLPMARTDTRYSVTLRSLLAVLVVLFVLPFIVPFSEGTLSNVLWQNFGIHWSVVIALYIAVLAVLPSVIGGNSLRALNLQMILFLIIIVIVPLLVGGDAPKKAFSSGDAFVLVHLWLFVFLGCALVACAIYGARNTIRNRLRKIAAKS